MNSRIKKIAVGTLSAMLILSSLAACGDSTSTNSTTSTGSDASTASTTAELPTGTISLLTREDGSGTRGAFIELFEIEEKDENGDKVDKTSELAEVTNSTAVMLSTVAGNKKAIGYVSLGSLDDSVKALSIDGAEATVDNIKSGNYKVCRPFNICYKGGHSELAQDFVDYILSTEGQTVVGDNGYIPLEDTTAYTASGLTGTVTVAGSSSVSPVMEKLAEAYETLNPGTDIQVQTSDSTTGVTSAAEGVADIGMASRALKDSELEQGLTEVTIATDGIAVIVNLENGIDGLTSEQVKSIWVGETTKWDDVQ